MIDLTHKFNYTNEVQKNIIYIDSIIYIPSNLIVFINYYTKLFKEFFNKWIHSVQEISVSYTYSSITWR